MTPSGSSPRQKKMVVIGGTGFVGRHLLAALMERSDIDSTFAIHRSRPAWLQAAQVHAPFLDVHDTESLTRLLSPGTVVVNLLRPDGTGWFDAVTAHVLAACESAGLARYIHVSSIDVFGDSPVMHITPASPASPVTSYEREHAHAEQRVLASDMASDAVVLRCGAVFGDGGLNVVSFVKEAAQAVWMKLAMRRMLYGERRMHLVSVQRVTEVVLAAATEDGVVQPRDMFLLTDDDASENNFAYLQDRLMSAFRRVPVAGVPALPPAALASVLRWRGISNTNPVRRFVDPRLNSLVRSKTTFTTELDGYIARLRAAA